MSGPRLIVMACAVSATIVLGACAGTDTGAATTAGVDGQGSSSGAVDSTTPDQTETPTTTPIETTTTTEASPPVIAGADPIEQVTPTSGGGIRPLLEWMSVEGAATYFVIVYTESGEPYWSAVTTESSTFVGGPLQIPSDRTGPNVSEGYTWAVYADAADGLLIAASPLREIGP